MKRIACFAAITFFTAAPAIGNIANPNSNRSKAVDTTLSIRLDRDAAEARLIIPKSQIAQLRAELEKLDDGSSAATAGTVGTSGLQTIISGVFLSLAIIFGGVWALRTGRLSTRGNRAAAAVILFSAGAFASIVYANAGPPPEARSITGKMFTQSVHMYGFGSGKIKLEVSETERYPTLIVPNPKTETKPVSEE